MPIMPTLVGGSTSRSVTDTFFGYNHHLKIQDGELYDARNMTTDDYPMLATRPKRGIVRQLRNPQGMIQKDALAFVDNGTLYVNGQATPLTQLSAGEKQLVGMGAYICIFPDKVYYNTEDALDYGSMEAHYSYSGSVSYRICMIDGVEYENSTVSPTAPPNPQNGDTWIDTSGSSPALYQWSSAQGDWVGLATVYTKIIFNTHGQIPAMFKEYDGVTISGTYFPDELDGTKAIYACGGSNTENDWVAVIGFPTAAFTDESEQISIDRNVPDMDYVCEAQNRLWGCFYGNDGAQNLNEIYCCALGDFKNWRQYMGLSTDSWTGSVGSDGQWTGAINYLGYPTFFKEGHIHRVSISSAGAHQLDDVVARGVQKGCSKSLSIVNETLLYKSRADICRYQGGFPEGVSEQLGDIQYSNAVAGTLKDKYYISMQGPDGEWQLFTYNLTQNLWMKEDELHAESFCSVGNELYCATDNQLYAMAGTEGTLEDDFEWMAETGIQYYQLPDRKYVQRYNIRMQAEADSEVRIGLEYDSNGVWLDFGTIRYRGTGTVTVPIRPRRCDHLKLRFTGMGQVKILSIARILENGSDV